MPNTDAKETQLYELVDAFEEAWQAGKTPAIDDHLPDEASLRRSVLVKLIHVDLEYRLKTGEQARVETYVERFPDIGGESTILVELVAWEFSLRRHREVELRPEEYVRRFPQFERELIERLQSEPGLKPRDPVRLKSPGNADRNLLLGILAFQSAFITKDQLLAAMQAWLFDKAKPLADILRDQGALDEPRGVLLDALVNHHVKQHGNDPKRSLQAVSSASSVRCDLEQLPDADLQASMVHLCAKADVDPNATESHFAGAATSDGTRFRVVRPHAKGGLGEVFVALDTELNREVALKEIQDRHADDHDCRARFLMEAEITGSLEHPGIVPIYGLGTYADGRPFYAMRFIHGDSLKEAIESFHRADVAGRDPGKRSLKLRHLLGRFIDVCQAIEYAHDRGVLHRDLKPGNIMLGKYGETLVVDWGLAKAAGKFREPGELATAKEERTVRPPSASDVKETVPGHAFGTGPFMSPEQAAGDVKSIGPASDVYSLGATLYTLLTGKPSVEGIDREEIKAKVLRGDISRPRQVKAAVPAALESICTKAMALKPANRYASPKVLANDIELWLGDEPVSTYREPATVRARRWARKHKSLVSGMAASLLVGLIALSAAAVWYQIQQAEEAQKQASAEEKVRNGLDQARKTRDELHAILKKPGGVHELLNQPARWQAKIDSARADWKRAEDHADVTGDPQWTKQVKVLDQELVRDLADYELAQRLEKIHLNKATLIDGKFDTDRAKKQYAAEFADEGLTPMPERQEEVALLIQQSAIKDQLVAALDDWGILEPARLPVLTVARLADPDPWRDKVRNPDLWKNKQAIENLARDAQADKEILARLSPQMLAMVSKSLPNGQTKESWLRSAQSLHPTDFWIAIELAHLFGENKNPFESEKYYRVALAIRPNTYAVYNNIGVALADQGDLPAAVTAYLQAIQIDPDSAIAWANLGGAHLRRMEPEAAVRAYNRAIAIDPNNTVAWTGLGNALLEQNETVAAVASHEKALAINPNFTEAWYNLGVLRGRQENPRGAVDAYKKVIAFDPDVAMAWTNLGRIYLVHDKDVPAAINALTRAVEIDSKLGPAWAILGDAFWKQSRLSAAIESYEKALAIDPKNVMAWSNLGRVLSENKEPRPATNAFKKALAIDANNASVWFALGNCLHDLKDYPAAIDAYERSLHINPKDARVWSNLGLAYYDYDKLPAAIKAYQTACDLSPEIDGIWRNLGIALYDDRKLPAAVKALEKSIEINPRFAFAHLKLGLALRDQNKFQEAAAAFQNAIALNPKLAMSHEGLGNVLHRQGNLPGAISAYQRAIDFDPNVPAYFFQLGNALREAHLLPEAIAAYKRATKLNPNFATAFTNLGITFHQQKKYPDAVAAFRKAIDLNRKLPQAWGGLGLALSAVGKFSDAEDALKKSVDLYPPNHAFRLINLNRSKECQQFGVLEKRASAVIDKNDTATPEELVQMACLLQELPDRHASAAQLFQRAFKAKPELLEDRANALAYRGARAAAMAGTSIEKNSLGAGKKAKLRQLAYDCLRIEVEKYETSIQDGKAGSWLVLESKISQLRVAPDFAGVRDTKALALPESEQADWGKLWDHVDKLLKEARSFIIETKHTGSLTEKNRYNVHEIRMKAGITYVAEMTSTELNSHLILHDSSAKVIAKNDGISASNMNAQIIYPSVSDGVYRIVATSFKQAGHGAYTLTIREINSKIDDSKWEAIRTGKAQLETAAQAIDFANQSTKKRHYALATRLYREAFRKDPALADNLDLGHRFNAAGYAVLAAAGKGDDAADLKAEQSAQLRQEALAWLKADLASWTKRVADGTDADRKAAAKKLRLWQRDTDLTWVREGELNDVPAAERPAWQQLWTDVAALLKKVDPGP